MSTSREKNMLMLRSSDNVEFPIEESAAIQSTTIKYMVDDGCASTVIPIPNVESKVLAQVITYLNKHADSSVSEGDMKQFDAEFVRKDFPELFDLVLAAHYLNIENLLDICNNKIAKKIENKSVEKVREIFGIENDFTPEEEAKIRKEKEWAFEDVNDDDED